ncbi:unannotated protein [freshwater metagenome]|uniref:Unannotated protein n=1 Tax=freshwater metagenome TaxID=449393 RepID=A0A6J7SL87_9ZZZZ
MRLPNGDSGCMALVILTRIGIAKLAGAQPDDFAARKAVAVALACTKDQ